jgi:hypothetical protein
MSIAKYFAFRCNGQEEGVDIAECEVMTDPIDAHTASYAWSVARSQGWHSRFKASGSRTLPGTLHYCPSCWAKMRA